MQNGETSPKLAVQSTLSAVDNVAKQGPLCSSTAFPGDRLSLASSLGTNHTARLSILTPGLFPVYFVSHTHLEEQRSPLFAVPLQAVL